MKKVAQEIEELMWALAEQRDPRAIDEFGRRYPELRGELGKRLALTTSLKGAYSDARPTAIPRFKPQPQAIPIWGKPAALAFACCLLIGLAFGSYYLTSSLSAGRSTSSSPQPQLIAPPSTNVAIDREHKVLPDARTTAGAPNLQPSPELANQPGYMKPQSLSIKAGKFTDVLALLAQSTGLQIEMPDVPPDMAEMTIDAEYAQTTPMAMLQDLGSRYGFTAFGQGGNKVLLIPARARTEPTTTSGG